MTFPSQSMYLFRQNRKRVLLLLVLGLQTLLVAGGFFDGFGKHNKDDNKGPVDEEGDRLAQDLARLDQVPPRRPGGGGNSNGMIVVSTSKKPNKFSNMMSFMSNSIQNDKPQSVVYPEALQSARDFVRNRNGDNKSPEVETVTASPVVPGQTIRPTKKPSVSIFDTWANGIKNSYTKTIDGIGAAGRAVVEATDSISATLKLDSHGRLLSLLTEVEDDLAFVRREFSSFSILWANIMRSSLSYVGPQGLEKLNKLDKDMFDFRRDALNAAAFGYEFMRIMMTWREELIMGHHAYMSYLKQVIDDQSKNKFTVDELFMYQLEVIHNYILLNCWMELDNISIESKMKLDYLMGVIDMKPKNYESENFRNIIILQELYDPTSEELKAERKQVVEALSETKGVSDEQFEEIDNFLTEFRNDLVQHPEDYQKVDWECPKELTQFMVKMGPELRYNRLIYEKSFLKDLKVAKEKAMAEMYGG